MKIFWLFAPFIVIWFSAYIIGVLLPQNWIREWYAIPTVITIGASIVLTGVIPGYLDED